MARLVQLRGESFNKLLNNLVLLGLIGSGSFLLGNVPDVQPTYGRRKTNGRKNQGSANCS
jgi:hypothetical protein